MRAIEIENLSYFYYTDFLRRKIPALKQVNLSIEEGECFGYLGPNGAGKTTTIKCILGLIRPRAGHIRIFGRSSLDTAARESVGYLPEQPYFYDYLTVAETLEMYGTLTGLHGAALRSAVSQSLERLDMLSRSSSRMRSLSKGLTQRVAMAQAIIASPRLLILDEPFSGLDPIGRQQFRQLLFELRKDGVTILTSSHILSDVEYLCDRASIATKGEIRSIIDLKKRNEVLKGHYELVLRTEGQVPPDLLQLATRTRPQGPTVVLEFESEEQGRAALALALNRHCTIERWEFCHSSLEDMFMSVVQH